MTVFLSVFAHTFHDMSNICHAVFRCLKLSLSQISEENTVNYKPWCFIHCVWLQWAFKWPLSLSPAAIWIFVPPLNSLGFVDLWRCKTYWRRDCGLIWNFSMFELVIYGPFNNGKKQLHVVIPQREISGKSTLSEGHICSLISERSSF